MKKITLLISACMLTVATTLAQGQFWYVGYPNSRDITATLGFSGPTATILTLTIRGTGTMQDFMPDRIPWFDFAQLIESLVIEEGVTTIGDRAFMSSFLRSLSISASVTTIGKSAFYNCPMLSGTLTIPNGVTTIKEGAFENCPQLSVLTIPESLTTIESDVFWYCIGLTSVNNYAIAPQNIDRSVFEELTLSNITLNVPVSSLALYQEAAVWQDFNIVGLYCKVKATAGSEEYGAVSADAWYELGGNASLTAAPFEGYEFVSWTKDGVTVSTENPYTFSVTEDVELVANFRGMPTAWNDIPADNAAVVGYYSMLGAKLTHEPLSGVYIVRYDNGKTEKVVRTMISK